MEKALLEEINSKVFWEGGVGDLVLFHLMIVKTPKKLDRLFARLH